MNKTFEKIYSENNVILNKDMALFEKVYAEAEMLNEMNPKLRALLAAGLIGTAGLGATSCSTPNDDYEEPTAIEQPATPETPGSTTETPAETEDTKETAALSGFKVLGVEDYAENLVRAVKKGQQTQLTGNKYLNLIYKNGFVPVEFNENNQYEDGYTYTRYIDPSDKTSYFIPVNMEFDFDTAIAAYKAAHAE